MIPRRISPRRLSGAAAGMTRTAMIGWAGPGVPARAGFARAALPERGEDG